MCTQPGVEMAPTQQMGRLSSLDPPSTSTGTESTVEGDATPTRMSQRQCGPEHYLSAVVVGLASWQFLTLHLSQDSSESTLNLASAYLHSGPTQAAFEKVQFINLQPITFKYHLLRVRPDIIREDIDTLSLGGDNRVNPGLWTTSIAFFSMKLKPK